MADAAALPDVRALADALHIAFDDLRALPRPGEHDPDAPTPEGLVSQAGRRLVGGMAGAVSTTLGSTLGSTLGRATRSMIGSATRSVAGKVVDAAVSQVTSRPRASAKPAPPPRAKKPGRAG
jgi:hypothetical protein